MADGMKPLHGKVAVVAGATRGAGRGIACMLGEAGATVYCTGRSSRNPGGNADKEAPSRKARPETIEETAEKVDAFGGKGIPVRVDHMRPDQVEALFARVKNEQGRLDILVNDVWGGDDAVEWGKPFWELSLEKGLPMLNNALHTHIITSRYGAPLLMETGGGLIVEITDGNTLGYRGNLLYDLVKSSVIRLAYAQAFELRRHGISAVAVTPGFLRSEAMLELFGVTEADWKDGAKKDPNFIASETPFFVGRAVAAMAADPRVAEKSGRVFSSWDLSGEYGFTDIDGEKPHWGRHWEQAFGKPLMALDEGYYAYGKDSPIEVVQPDWP
ncbi:MAG: dehydrogenase/reductase family er [Fibrobacteres bacterium]|nr:dehydrogenase/reductase family er [Fibrobacterota bacterium]